MTLTDTERAGDGHAAVLRSIANSIEPAFPDAADILRGIARERAAPDERAVERAALIVTHLAVEGRIDGGCGRTVVTALRAALAAPSPGTEGDA